MVTAKELDKMYTNTDIARRLIDETCNILNIDLNQVEFVEPSAGSGSFSKFLPNVHAYDIEPDDASIVIADFLRLEPEWQTSAIAIGNPPFGYRMWRKTHGLARGM